jgi:hypothetical protein
MLKIRIDNQPFTFTDSTQHLSIAQKALIGILKAIAQARPEGDAGISSQTLMNLLGLTRPEPYEFRLRHLVQGGYLTPTSNLEQVA